MARNGEVDLALSDYDIQDEAERDALKVGFYFYINFIKELEMERKARERRDISQHKKEIEEEKLALSIASGSGASKPEIISGFSDTSKEAEESQENSDDSDGNLQYYAIIHKKLNMEHIEDESYDGGEGESESNADDEYDSEDNEQDQSTLRENSISVILNSDENLSESIEQDSILELQNTASSK